MRLRWFWAVLALSFLGPLQAQDTYPGKPVRVVIPFPPGGTLDQVGRLLAQRLGEQCGQTVLIDNRPGCGWRSRTGERRRDPHDRA